MAELGLHSLLTVLFDGIIVQYVTSRDNGGTGTTVSDKNNLSVAVEHSIVVQRSANRTANGTVDTKHANLQDIEEEIYMSNFGAPHAGSRSTLSRLEGDYASERRLDSMEDLELGNKTNVYATKDTY